MATSVHPKIAHAHACMDTGSMKGLIEASWKLGYDKSHGKLYAWIDSSASFLQTAAFAPIRLVTHLAFAALGLIGVIFQSGRRFFVENLIRSFIDLSAIGIGLVGTIYPWAGYHATAKEVDLLNRYVLKRDALQESETKGKILASPLYLLKYVYAYMQRSHVLSAEHWGGEKKLVKAAKG